MAGEYTASVINVNGGGSLGGSTGGGSGGGAGGFGMAMIANALVGSLQAIESGRIAKAMSDYNKVLLEGKIKWLDFQKGIVSQQWDRARGKFIGKAMVSIAGAGLMPSGSPMAALTDSLTQINIDKAIEMANIDMQKVYTGTAIQQQEIEGKGAVRASKVNAFSSLLQGSTNYAMYKGFTSK